MTKSYYDEKLEGKEPEYRFTFSRYIDDKYISDIDKSDNWIIYIDQVVLSNYSNVLSIMCSERNNFNIWGPMHKFVNVNLINGDDIKIEEIFTKDIYAFEKYKDSIYTTLAQGNVSYESYDTWVDEDGYEHTWGMGNGFYEEVDVKTQEELVNKFKYTEDISFGFNDSILLVEFENKKSTIDFSSNPEEIAIFNRFKNNNIYNGKYNKSTNVPAFYNSSTGKIVSSKSFVQDGNVILNYYINYEGDFINQDNYASLIYYAEDTIENQIKLDTSKLNNLYSGDGYIIYSANFNIQICEVGINNATNKEYENFLKTGTQYYYWNYEPEVYEISKNDYDILISDFANNLYSPTEFNNVRYFMDEKGEYTSEIKYAFKKYIPFYRVIAKNAFKEVIYDYLTEPYFRSIYNEYNVLIERDKISKTTQTRSGIYGNNLLDYVVKDNSELAQYYFDTHPEIWNYKDLSRDNYKVTIEGDWLSIDFPYYHVGKESWENYSTDEHFGISINKIKNNFDKNVYLKDEWY